MSYGTSNPVRYFGQQVRRARRAAGWTLAEFGQRIGYDPGQISRIENGKRPPTELFAQMCDRAFPGRDGWFGEFYAESRTWIATPPWFRSWVEHEQQAATLRIWQLSVLSGLLQTEQYARAILAVNPGVTEEQVSERLAARLGRQAILARDDPPAAWFLVDEAALRRCVGSADVMAAQLGHLAGVARLPNVTIQVVPEYRARRAARRLRGRRARRLRRDRGCRAGVRGRRHHRRADHPFRYAQERSVPGVRIPDLDRADVRGMDSIWRKSSYSGANGGECVEVATAGAVLVRDTADRGGPVLTFTTDVWRAFTAAIR